MTTLVIHPDTDADSTTLRTTDAGEITAELARRGVRYEQWAAGGTLAPGAGSDDVLAAYAADVDRLRSEGYETVDVVRLVPDESDPDWPATAAVARQKFLAEHTHADDEVRFFVEGRGAFYLRIDGEVLIVVCEAGDLLSVPADTTHWFDMGTRPHFAAIRFFRIAEGWVGNFTGDDIAERFEAFDDLVAV
jgi:1,2-dihydroxy-3-keto-5-methylthiopentene dioxygenase